MGEGKWIDWVRRRRVPIIIFEAALIELLIVLRLVHTGVATGASALDVVVSEIAWMGTKASSAAD